MRATRLRVPEALDRQTLAVFSHALDAAEASVLTLEAATDAVFCAGLDLAGLAALDASEREGALGLAGETLLKLATLPRPTLAAVTGRSSGGGVGLAAACDVVIADPSATFALPEALFGLEPAIIAPLLLRRMSQAALRRLSLLGTAIGAEEAWRLGLVDELAGGGEHALERAVTRAERALARAHPDSVRVIKAEPAAAGELRRAIEAGRQRTAARLADPEVLARVRRFTEEGVPPWEAVGEEEGP